MTDKKQGSDSTSSAGKKPVQSSTIKKPRPKIVTYEADKSKIERRKKKG